MKKIIGILAWLALVSACERPSTDRLQVLVSIVPQKYLVERLGGDRVKVHLMVKPGQSPEMSEPDPRQILDLSAVRLCFLAGLPSEELWVPSVKEGFPGMRFYDPTDAIPRISMESSLLGHIIEEDGHHHEPGTPDHHVWTSPRLFLEQARAMTVRLEEWDPEYQAVYRTNFLSLEKELLALDQELRLSLQPYRGRGFLVLHPAWGYLAREYGLVQYSIEIEGREPSPQEILRLMEKVQELSIRSIFVQPQESPRVAELLARRTGAIVVSVDPLAYDYPANLRSVVAQLISSWEAQP